MIERFKYYMPSQIIEDKCTGKRYYGNQAVCDLLNALHEENEQLKHELLCKQLDKAPTEPINCKCHYEVKE